ncbi:hypothetical protein GOODEAATRI_018494 [Goodea atripinnis]|uniref:Secreted protein n=1 Tax=Goodea atripinnis TaxID=208336 RepID=A0ABV0MIW1_9TELE
MIKASLKSRTNKFTLVAFYQFVLAVKSCVDGHDSCTEEALVRGANVLSPGPLTFAAGLPSFSTPFPVGSLLKTNSRKLKATSAYKKFVFTSFELAKPRCFYRRQLDFLVG